jgi:hypothetical protein
MRWVSLAVVCSLTLIGCGGQPERADTLPVADEASTSTVAKAPVETPVAPPAEKSSTLTAAQAKSALLTLDDMPTGWTQSKPEADDDEDPTVTPKRCSAVLDAVDQQGKPLAEAEATFSPGDLGPQLDHTVSSWPRSQVPVLNKLTAAFRQCPKFTSTSADGSSATFQASGLSFPNVGDRTLALRLKAKSDGINLVMDVIYIAKGNNGIALMVTGFQPLDGATLEKLARKAVARLDAAAR